MEFDTFLERAEQDHMAGDVPTQPALCGYRERLRVHREARCHGLEIWGKANQVMKDLNAEERDRLPGYVRAALVDREPIKVGPPPYR